MTDMPVIDAQVHAYEKDHPGRPWVGALAGPPEVTGDDMVAAMDAVGVDGALLVSPWSMYRYDASYALEVHATYGDRFGLIRPFDLQAPDLEAQLEHWAATSGAVGIRIVLLHGATASAGDRGVQAVMAGGARFGLPVNILCWGQLQLFSELAARYPQTQLVLDHLGLTQTFEPPPPEHPFEDLPDVLALATHENVAIKITGACTLSRETFPFVDIHEPMMRILEAFGVERCLWGTDWTRAVNFLDYAEGVDAFRRLPGLSDEQRGLLMGGSLARIYGWSPGRDERAG